MASLDPGLRFSLQASRRLHWVSRLAPLLVQAQHQIHLLVRYLAHVSSFGFESCHATNSSGACFFPSIFTKSAVSPPVETTLPAISAALARQKGHMNCISYLEIQR